MDKKLILAVVLSMAVVLGFQAYQAKQAKQVQLAKGDKPSGKTLVAAQDQSFPDRGAIETLPGKTDYLQNAVEKTITLENNNLRLELSTFGATIKDAFLKNFPLDPAEGDDSAPVNLVLPDEKSERPLSLTFSVDGSYNNESYGPWKIIHNTNNEVVFQKLVNGGVVVTKRYTFGNTDNLLDVEVLFKNEGVKDLNIDDVTVIWPKGIGSTPDLAAAKLARVKKGGLARIDGKLFEKKTGGNARVGVVDFAAVLDRYFTAMIIPESTSVGFINKPEEKGQSEIAVIYSGSVLRPGEKNSCRMRLYLGPKAYGKLKALDVGAEELVFSGWTWFFRADLWFPWVCDKITWLMNFFFRFIHNYGIAIILVTMLTKILTYPATRAQFKSMKKMQELQPKTKALKEKYKDNPTKLNQETMELYKKYKVNPLGGCLPMLAQMPIFIAFYIVIYRAVELRGASFLNFHVNLPEGLPFGMSGAPLWITDLSMKDPTYILPLLMGATMFFQQKLSTGVSADPTQAKMMMFMPVIFTALFLSFPSGLVLYWFVSNLLGIAQQIFHNVEEGKSWDGKQKQAASA